MSPARSQASPPTRFIDWNWQMGVWPHVVRSIAVAVTGDGPGHHVNFTRTKCHLKPSPHDPPTWLALEMQQPDVLEPPTTVSQLPQTLPGHDSTIRSLGAAT